MALKQPRVLIVADLLADLPSVGEETGEAYFVLADGTIRVWNGSSFIVSAGGVQAGAVVSAATPLSLASGTIGAGVADTVKLGSVDRSAGNTILSLATEGTGAVVTGTPAASTGAVAFSVNGVVYYLTASTSAPT